MRFWEVAAHLQGSIMEPYWQFMWIKWHHMSTLWDHAKKVDTKSSITRCIEPCSSPLCECKNRAAWLMSNSSKITPQEFWLAFGSKENVSAELWPQLHPWQKCQLQSLVRCTVELICSCMNFWRQGVSGFFCCGWQQQRSSVCGEMGQPGIHLDQDDCLQQHGCQLLYMRLCYDLTIFTVLLCNCNIAYNSFLCCHSDDVWI